MDHATQVTLARRLLDFLDRRTTEMAAAPYENPVAVYTSAAQLIEERRCLFRRHDARQAGCLQRVPFRDLATANQSQRFGAHGDRPEGDGFARGDRFGADVDHLHAPARVDMG